MTHAGRPAAAWRGYPEGQGARARGGGCERL